MRRLSLGVVLAGLMASSWIYAQAAAPGEHDRAQTVSTKGVDLAGQVSKDGKTLVAEDDNVWSVNNAALLKGLEGRNVTVKCRMDLSQHAIRVLYVEPATKQSVKPGDSAFRR